MDKKLNKLLADFVVTYHKLQSFHWYVTGRDFFNVHAKLEEFYDGINDGIDEIAEVMLMSGYKPISTMKAFQELSDIEEAQGDYISGEEVYTAVQKDFTALKKEVEEIKKAADAADNYLVSAKMDTYIEEFAKAIWMMSQAEK